MNRRAIHDVVRCVAGIAVFLIWITGFTQASALAASVKPRVLLDSYTISEGGAVPEQEFVLTLVLRNTSFLTNVESLVLTFSSENNYARLPYGVGDQIYVDNIPAGQTAEVAITLRAGQRISGASFVLRVNAVFADHESSSNSNSFSIHVPIIDGNRLTIQNIFYPQTISAGDEVELQATFRNTGSSTLYNILMTITGDGVASTQQFPIESLAAGSTGNAEATLVFHEEGTQSQQVSFSYQDASGNSYTTNAYEATFNVLQDSDPDDSESSEVDTEPGGYLTNNLLRAMLFIAAIFFAVLVISLARKYKN